MTKLLDHKSKILCSIAFLFVLGFVLLSLFLYLIYQGWLPGGDHVLGGRSIHSFRHYFHYFTKLYLLVTGWIAGLIVLALVLRWWAQKIGGWRRFAPRFIFMLCFTALLAEVTLRVVFALPGGLVPAVQKPDLLGEAGTDDFYWVLTHRLSGQVAREYVIPSLGWSQQPPTPGNPLGLEQTSLENLARPGPMIQFYGDSFVHGMLHNVKKLPDMVAEKSGWNVVNLGVRGYGVDQMYLLAKEIGLPPAGSEVWVGILTWDLDRTYLAYSYGQKPRFTFQDGHLELKNIPLTISNEEFVKNFRMPFRSWLVQAFRRYASAGAGLEREGPDKHEKIALNHEILAEWADWCRQAGITMRIVLFRSNQDLLYDGWRDRAIRAYAQELGLPAFDTAEVLRPLATNDVTSHALLYEQNDFHHTDSANDLIAKWMADAWLAGHSSVTNTPGQP